jgi:fibronectin-binding autotransporter adhesin
MMNGKTLPPLRAAIQQALAEARAARRTSSASVITLLALSATALSPLAKAADTYSANDDTSLRTAITDANGDGDLSATITLTADIALASATAFPALTKPITINTNGFTLNGQSGTLPGGSLTFSGSTVTIVGTGVMKGGDGLTADGNINQTGGTGLLMTNGSVINSASITGGKSGANATAAADSGPAGVSLTNGSLTNDGSITGGIGGTKSAGDAPSGGPGTGGVGVNVTNGALTNNGQITGGRGGDYTGSFNLTGAAGGLGAALSGGSHINNGTIRGGGAGAVGQPGNPGGIGVTLSNGATFVNNAGALVEGGPATGAGAAIGLAMSGNGVALTNHGTIRGGTSGAANGGIAINVSSSSASTLTITNTGTIESFGATPAITIGTFPTINVNLSVINSGTIRTGTNAATAIQFGINAAAASVLELHPGSVIVGNVNALAANAGDTLRLGGSGTDTLDASGIGSKYSGFAVFEKNNTSTWTLTGTTTALTPWRLLGGTLSVSENGSLGSAPSALTFNAGTLQNTAAFSSARAVTLNAGGGTFDTAADLTWTGLIGGAGALTKTGAGTLVLSANNGYTGATNVNAGTLRVNGTQSTATGVTSVAGGATIGGSGRIGGAVTIADGGHLAPGNSPGTLNMGALTLNAGSVLDFELGEANVVGGTWNDLVNVNGDLVLDGTLNVTPSSGGTFGAGVYRLINYTGNLTNNGLELGLMPAGSSNYIQTSFANQVNLINTQGLVLNYWDGAADARSNGLIGGGTGTWQAATGNDNWTGSDGTLNAGYQADSLAIFAGTAGTVTVDGSKGDVRISGMQFASDGYRIEGDAVTLATGLNSLRVGDGTDTGSAFSATIASALTGDGTLDKTDLGTLVLTGENSYSGGTRVSAGTLQIGDGGTTGSLVGDVANEGVLAFDRSDAGTFAGVISGSGSFEQIGGGSTTLTGVNTYTGATTIRSGTLALAGAGSIAASNAVVNDGAFDISASDAGTSITTLSGSGSLILGSKALTLTAPTTTFAGVIDGAAGTLNKAGAGTWTLTGAGSQLNTLNVQAGTLALAGSASLATQNTSVAAGATVSSGGTLTGTAGNDTLALAGTLVGNVSFLGGDDRLQIADGANFSQATFDGGAGTDTLELTYGSALSLQNAPATTSFERLITRGNGAFTLSGTVDEFSDSITVAQGSLQLSNANIVTDELRIESGVTVTGTGSLSGNLVNAGVLSPGHSPGILHVGGNFTQAATGALVSEITASGTDLIDVAGSATLGGTHQINVEYGRYLEGTTQTLIRANGGITGDFASVQMNPSVLMTSERQLTANAEAVHFERVPITALGGLSAGRARFASYLEEQIGAGNVDPAMSAYIDTLLQQNTAEGVANLLGERAEPVASVTQNSVSMLGAGFARTVFERFTLSDAAQCAPTQAGTNDTLNCFWAHGLRQWGNASGDSRYDWTSNGGQFGIDRNLSSDWAVGATFGYADTDTHDPSGGRNETRSKMGGLYASYAPGRLNVGAMAFYSGNDNDTRRTVLLGGTPQQARADFDSDSFGVGVRVGYRVTSESAPLVRPFVEAFYDHLERTQFSETDAGAGNLSANVHGRDGLRGTVGLQLADNFEGYGRVFRPALELGVAHQFADVRSTLDLQPFSAAPAFRTYGPALDRTSYLARASLNVSLGDNASVALGYGGELADDYSQHEGNLNFRIAW